jgi:hypothetical protein
LLPCSNFGDWDQPFYPELDSGNDGEEGLIAEIKKCAECDSDDESYPEHDLGNDGEEGVTAEINKQNRCDLRD